jgi:hypothetical protein
MLTEATGPACVQTVYIYLLAQSQLVVKKESRCIFLADLYTYVVQYMLVDFRVKVAEVQCVCNLLLILSHDYFSTLQDKSCQLNRMLINA